MIYAVDYRKDTLEVFENNTNTRGRRFRFIAVDGEISQQHWESVVVPCLCNTRLNEQTGKFENIETTYLVDRNTKFI